MDRSDCLLPPSEYLVSYGSAGDFSRFRPVPVAEYGRGDRVVIRSPQGLAIGHVLCPATVSHEPFLGRTAIGELLRPVTPDDERLVAETCLRSQAIAAEARRLAAEMALPLTVLDVELSLDGRQATVNHLLAKACDYRPLVSTLARLHDVIVIMQNLSIPHETEEAEGGGCGRPDCGGGGCSSCGSGGGCSTGSCGAGHRPEEVADLLDQMGRAIDTRVPLL